MLKRELLYTEDMEALLIEYQISVSAIEEFLSFYNSKAVYRSAIHDLLIKTETLDVTKLTYEHYIKHVPEESHEMNTQQNYKNSFFKFLYAMDYLENPEGFENRLHKASLLKQFSRNNNRPKGKKNESKSFTIEELLLIQPIIESHSTKYETLKKQFCWYAIFELGIPVDEIRKNITSNNYSNGQLTTSIGTFTLPEKFDQMFIELSKRDYNGFAILDTYIANIGIDAKLEKKLIPSMIKSARTNCIITCGNCLNPYTNLSYNWCSINDRIVCNTCAERIKKNSIQP